jgi:outer membrane protein, heavy metal efflux system
MVSAETERDNSYAALGSLVGLPGSDMQLVDKLVFAAADYKLSGLRELAAASRPDIRAAKSTVDSFRAAVSAVKAESSPDLFLEGRHSSIDPTIGGNSVRLGMTFPLVDLGRRRAEVAAAQAALAEQQAKLDGAVRTAGLEVETSFNSLQQARKNVESFQSGRLQRAADLMDMAQTGYDKGAFTYLEVLDAQNVYRSEQADYDRALAAYNTALAALERSVGGHLP